MAHQIVKMYHEETGNVGETTVEAYHSIYQFRGWELLGAAEAYASEALGRNIGKLDDLKVDELREVIGYSGSQEVPPANSKKADVIKALREVVPGGDAPAVVANVNDDGSLTGPTGEELPDPKDENAVQTVKSTPSGGRAGKTS